MSQHMMEEADSMDHQHRHLNTVEQPIFDSKYRADGPSVAEHTQLHLLEGGQEGENMTGGMDDTLPHLSIYSPQNFSSGSNNPAAMELTRHQTIKQDSPNHAHFSPIYAAEGIPVVNEFLRCPPDCGPPVVIYDRSGKVIGIVQPESEDSAEEEDEIKSTPIDVVHQNASLPTVEATAPHENKTILPRRTRGQSRTSALPEVNSVAVKQPTTAMSTARSTPISRKNTGTMAMRNTTSTTYSLHRKEFQRVRDASGLDIGLEQRLSKYPAEEQKAAVRNVLREFPEFQTEDNAKKILRRAVTVHAAQVRKDQARSASNAAA